MSFLLGLNLTPIAPFSATHENWMMPDGHDALLHIPYYARCLDDTDGVLYMTFWKTLETAQGVYDFSTITNALDYVAGRGKKLIVRTFYKSFSAAHAKPLPSYILDDHVTYGGSATTGGLWVNSFGGYSPRFNNPAVMARFKALITAMADEFGDHPALQGIAPDESAWGFGALWGTPATAGLTAAQVRNAHREICLHIQICFPDKEIYPFYSYCDGSPDADVIAELKWSISQGMCAGITDTHRLPGMIGGIQPVASAFPVPAKTVMCVDFMSTGADDSGLTERYLENARTTALRGADITVWYARGGATSSYWAAAKNAMAIIG
ncbi:hypothetical protein [Nitrosovibrio sp. Nv4]|uniref:hypothetical protein n=1 Tax=Nitrosovibrio sp. Nv4 TaxID=1945880 RepID=UPI000BD5D3DB|nr:hypothetical protein [Nitrosovibrio sp. Nv4]SOD41731.1 hypothetical protein SAMN06298226_2033 [Nitrosovibrio sp. Nv4]